MWSVSIPYFSINSRVSSIAFVTVISSKYQTPFAFLCVHIFDPDCIIVAALRMIVLTARVMATVPRTVFLGLHFGILRRFRSRAQHKSARLRPHRMNRNISHYRARCPSRRHSNDYILYRIAPPLTIVTRIARMICIDVHPCTLLTFMF